MGIFVKDETVEKIKAVMFVNFSNTSAEEFLKKELARYVPQFLGKEDEEIIAFAEYMREVYVNGMMPEIGVPLASLNPTFVDSTEAIKFSLVGGNVYTRASLKENGYRFQLHNGAIDEQAFTRQFTAYDLRMFPELKEVFKSLPVMIGDAELISKYYKHLAGFNRLQIRIPGTAYWPPKGSDKVSEELINKYFANKAVFRRGKPIKEFELTLCFHGLFAIAHPSTWNKSRKEQLKSMISLCKLPINYKLVDELLDQLAVFIEKNKINARVVERRLINSKEILDQYVEEKRNEGVEGACAVQFAWDKSGTPSFAVGKSFKIKNYETIDMALMGLYLKKKEDGLNPDNITGCLLGLFDYALSEYLPAVKVNLDPAGPQIKTDGQRERLVFLRDEISKAAKDLIIPDGKIVRLHDVYVRQGEIMLKHLLGEKAKPGLIEEIIESLPRSKNLISLFQMYRADRKRFKGEIKKPNIGESYIIKYREFFDEVIAMIKPREDRFVKYFSRAPEIKKASARLVKPQFVVDVREPIIVEAQIFDIKWGACPFPAGFHSWYCDSFHFTNAFAERIRNDKNTTTDYETIYDLARAYTVKKKKVAKQKNKKS